MRTEVKTYKYQIFLLVTDRIKAGDMLVQHCPMEAMLTDFVTKPLEGGLFHRFQDVIMGWKPVSI